MCVLPPACMRTCRWQLLHPCAQVNSWIISTAEREAIQPSLWIITGSLEEVPPLCPLYVSDEKQADSSSKVIPTFSAALEHTHSTISQICSRIIWPKEKKTPGGDPETRKLRGLGSTLKVQCLKFHLIHYFYLNKTSLTTHDIPRYI